MSRDTTLDAGDRFGASLPSNAASASWKSPVDTPQVENRQQCVEALRPPRPLRQNRRGEPDFFLRAHLAPIAHLGAPETICERFTIGGKGTNIGSISLAYLQHSVIGQHADSLPERRAPHAQFFHKHRFGWKLCPHAIIARRNCSFQVLNDLVN